MQENKLNVRFEMDRDLNNLILFDCPACQKTKKLMANNLRVGDKITCPCKNFSFVVKSNLATHIQEKYDKSRQQK